MKYLFIILCLTNFAMADDADYLKKEVPAPPVDGMLEPVKVEKVTIVEVKEEPGFFSEYEFEANLFAQSIRTANSPLIGPSIIWEISESLFIGSRALISLSGTSEESGYSFELLQRWKFIEKNS